MRNFVLLSALLFSSLVLASSEEENAEFTSKLYGEGKIFEVDHKGIAKSLLEENAIEIFNAVIKAEKERKENDDHSFFGIGYVMLKNRMYELAVRGTFVSIMLCTSRFGSDERFYSF